MFTLLKCRKCREANWFVKDLNENCAKCGMRLQPGVNADYVVTDTSAGKGLYRDGELLVLGVYNGLLQACVKCGSTKDLQQARVEFRYVQGRDIAATILTNAILLPFGGWGAVWTVQPVDVPLCPQHWKGGWNTWWKDIGVWYAVSAVLFILPLIVDWLGLGSGFFQIAFYGMIIGGWLFIIGLFKHIAFNKPLKQWKKEGNYLWFSGASEEYLKLLPKLAKK